MVISTTQPLTPAQVKQNLKDQGKTLKQWALDNEFSYDNVSKVLNGVRKANYGLGHQIAVKLGLKIEQPLSENT